MAGKTLEELDFTEEVTFDHVAVKESVFPFIKFPNVDTILGPEMKSTGEVMGLDSSFGRSFAKASMAASSPLPSGGEVFISVADDDKSRTVELGEKSLRPSIFYSLRQKERPKLLKRPGLPWSLC